MMELLHTTLKLGLADDEEVKGRVVQGGSLGTDDIESRPELPFVLWREMGSTSVRQVFESSRSKIHTFNLYVYDYRGDYTRIDRILREMEELIRPLAGQRSPSGARCIGSEWVLISQASEDETYDAIFKFGSVQLTGSQ